MHLHSTFHEICTIHECIHIVRTPKCREISQKVMAQPGFEPGTFLFRGCSNHWAIRPSLQLCDNFTCKFVKIWAQICDKIFRMNKIYSFKAYFELNFDPGPKFKLKMGFQNFLKFWQKWPENSTGQCLDHERSKFCQCQGQKGDKGEATWPRGLPPSSSSSQPCN